MKLTEEHIDCILFHLCLDHYGLHDEWMNIIINDTKERV